MAGYQPLYIKGMETGLVQSREEFILPDDAYPFLENAFVWRERIKRKQGYELLGRLQRVFEDESIGLAGASPWSFNIFTSLTPAIIGEPDKEIIPGTVSINMNASAEIFVDLNQDGTLFSNLAGTGTIDYFTGDVTLTHSQGAGVAVTITFNYAPGFPVMGLRQRQLNAINAEQLIAFDQKYAYRFTTEWEEFLPGTTWTSTDSDFFWSTNYWVGDGDLKIFWVNNFIDPIRYTNGQVGTNWINFTPQINSAGDLLENALIILPFRSRLCVFNTIENGVQYRQRIRWAAIGNPFSNASAIVTTVNPDAWRDDIRGQGGYLDIPTSEDIVTAGFVRDNLVIYCESSTWQLRYTGRSIAPFQIEKVNTELGAESTFSSVQFDTSLVGIGDKGIVQCDSFKSDRIDIKIPDLIFDFDNENNGLKRVHGIRDFQQRLAYWTYPYVSPGADDDLPVIFPNRRLVYNYENDSWAIFTDSLTTLGTFQAQNGRTWASSTFSWASANFRWFDRPSLFPSIVGGNQQGFVLYLDSLATNEISLSITGITGNDTTATRITCVNHNMINDTVIKISEIPNLQDFSNLNDLIFGIDVIDEDTFDLYLLDDSGFFEEPQLDPSSNTYEGGGKIAIRDNFSITSKKFNFLDDGQQIQMGYIDVLMNNTESGEVTLNVYMNYNDSQPVNQYPENIIPSSTPQRADDFFNTVVPTSHNSAQGIRGTKNWQRVFCPIRGQFITIEWTLSNEQLVEIAQESDVQIDSQILWLRKAGRLA